MGRLCTWNDLFPITLLPRSRYERVLGNAIAGRRVRIGGAWHKPVGMKGWTHVVFKRERDGVRHVRSLDDMLMHLDAWDRSADRRFIERRRSTSGEGELERRRAERRAQIEDTLERRRMSDQELTPGKPGGVADMVSPVPPPVTSPSAPPAAAPLVAVGRDEAPLVIVTRTT